MIAVQSLWFLLALVALGATDDGSCPKVCFLDDVDCVTKGGNDFFKCVVNGCDGLNAPMNKLYISKLDGPKGSPIHSMTNIQLQGMTKCKVTKLALDIYNQGYEHVVHCPELITTFDYKSSTDPFQRTKKVTITASQYDIFNIGRYGVFVNPIDFLPHFFIQTVYTEVDLNKKLNYYLHGDDLDSHRNVDLEYLHYVIVRRCMRTVLAGINAYFETHRMGEAFPKSNEKGYIHAF